MSKNPQKPGDQIDTNKSPVDFYQAMFELEEMTMWNIVDNLVRTITFNVIVTGMPSMVAWSMHEMNAFCERIYIDDQLRTHTREERTIYLQVINNLQDDKEALMVLYEGTPTTATTTNAQLPFQLLSESDSDCSHLKSTNSQTEYLLYDSSRRSSSQGSVSKSSVVLDFEPVYQNLNPTATAPKANESGWVECDNDVPLSFHQGSRWPEGQKPVASTTPNRTEENQLESLLQNFILPVPIADDLNTGFYADLKQELKKINKPRPKRVGMMLVQRLTLSVLHDIVDNLLTMITLLTDIVLPGLFPVSRTSVGTIILANRSFLFDDQMPSPSTLTAAEKFICFHRYRALHAQRMISDKPIVGTSYHTVIASLQNDLQSLYTLYNYQVNEEAQRYASSALNLRVPNNTPTKKVSREAKNTRAYPLTYTRRAPSTQQGRKKEAKPCKTSR